MATLPFCLAAPFVPHASRLCVCVCCVSIFVFSCSVFFFFWLSDRHCSLNLMSALAWLMGNCWLTQNTQRGREHEIAYTPRGRTPHRAKPSNLCNEYSVVYAALSALINEIRKRNIIWWIYCCDYFLPTSAGSSSAALGCPKGPATLRAVSLSATLFCFVLPSTLNSLCCLSSLCCISFLSRNFPHVAF